MQWVKPPVVPETLQEKADKAADRYGVSRVKLRNLVQYESGWIPDREGDGGESHGLVQIRLKSHPGITKEQAIDPDFALDYAAKAIQEGTESQFTVCNCYALVSTKVRLPRMAGVLPNTTPHVGAVAIFRYGEVKHIALVTKLSAEGFWVFEANKDPCVVASRFIEWGDPHLAGFFTDTLLYAGNI